MRLYNAVYLKTKVMYGYSQTNSVKLCAHSM